MEIHVFFFLCVAFLIQRVSAQTDVCKENEEFLECGSACPLNCSNYQGSLFCSKLCTKGCFCKPGYVVGPNQNCIDPQNCPIGPCRTNEIPSDCINPCNTCQQRGKCYFEYCSRGCDCRPGFFRNSSGICVPVKGCDVSESVCPANEHYLPCVNLCNDCWNRGDCEQPYCQPGCDCIPGYFRDDNGKCVPESRCFTGETNCGVGEEYSDCVIPCNDCISKGNCQYSCQYGCDCKRGFYRDSKGICIPAQQCSEPETDAPETDAPETDEPSGISGRNCRNCEGKCNLYEQYYLCMPTCKNTCENYNDTREYCNRQCRPGCFCSKGLVKTKDGTCVPPNECPKTCGKNEEFQECGTACPANCSNQNPVCAAYCVKGCFCKAEFVRDSNEKCILPTYCPPVCNENEHYQECGSRCQPSCDNPSDPPANCPYPCIKGCFCSPGFVRGPDGKCILPAFCPLVCKDNEEFQVCGSRCQPTCDNVSPDTSRCPVPCTKGCFCKPGYVRGPDATCILPTLCPAVCKDNEEFLECGSRCQPTCELISPDTSRCPAPCTRGCFCKPGFVRGPDATCILPSLCLAICEENEEFQECGSACPANCSNHNPACAPLCVRGCFCKTGFVKDSNGKCILQTYCPEVCKNNEEFRECGSACPLSCGNIGKSITCTLQCVRGCFCKDGYVRGPNGICIRPNYCPLECEAKEVFTECGTQCQAYCHNYTKPEPCIDSCFRGCVCKKDFVRGPNGKCIDQAYCPVDCGENEEYLQCGSQCPPACGNLNTTCNKECAPGCFCKPGFVRGPTGKCILPAYCPFVCGENEEYRVCGVPCQPTCKDRTISVVSCNIPCMKGCFCRPGFIRNTDGGCIDPKDCPPDFYCRKANEEYLECGPACVQTCAKSNPRYKCPSQCIKGCFCQPGFVRDIEDNCIRPTECPSEPERCPERQQFYDCMPICENTCENILRPNRNLRCRNTCRSGCFCRTGFVMRNDGMCVRPQYCTVSGTGPIEGRNRGDNDIEDNVTEITTVKLEQDITTLSLPDPTENLIKTTHAITTLKLSSEDLKRDDPPVTVNTSLEEPTEPSLNSSTDNSKIPDAITSAIVMTGSEEKITTTLQTPSTIKDEKAAAAAKVETTVGNPVTITTLSSLITTLSETQLTTTNSNTTMTQ